jgi:hypothetical protein
MIGSVLGPRRRPRPCTALGHLACLVFLGVSPSFWGCAAKQAETAPLPTTAARRQARAAAAARAEQDRRLARLELTLLEKNAQVEELQSKLDQAREEVVRAMAKLQTLASRAEAASGIAEAEVALQPLRGRSTQQTAPEAAQASRLLREASSEFNQENYGGALYLANQAKALAATGTGRLSSREHSADRPGEMSFAVPIPLKAVGSGNVREAPRTAAPIAFAVEGGDSLTGYSYLEDWVRISDEMGRGGWIYRKLISRR